MNLLKHIVSTSRVIYDKTYDVYVNYYAEEEKDAKLVDIKRIKPEDYMVNKLKNLYYKPTHVINNIYIGNAINAANYSYLDSLKIGLVINVTKEISNYFPTCFKYLKYDIYDNNDDSIRKHLDEILNEIDKFTADNKDKNIFIHCMMGASRSATVVIYYLMNKENMDFETAFQFLLEKRQCINPTIKFKEELIELYKTNPNFKNQRREPIVGSIIDAHSLLMEDLGA